MNRKRVLDNRYAKFPYFACVFNGSVNCSRYGISYILGAVRRMIHFCADEKFKPSNFFKKWFIAVAFHLARIQFFFQSVIDTGALVNA